ncbi:MAG: hypothetical protein GY936_00315 [Ignavibacteriae bacterium]|nr:hypothetical protein [Ignavibacteriota bacterium]
MNLYSSNTYSDEEGTAETDELLKICAFCEKVKKHLNDNDNCHMHLCDNFEGWTKVKNFDLEVNSQNNAE